MSTEALDFGFSLRFVDLVTDQSKKCRAAINAMVRSLERLDKVAGVAGGALSKVTAAMPPLATSTVAAKNATVASGAAMNEWSGRTAKATNTANVFAHAAQRMAAYLGIRYLAGAFKSALDVGIEFEQKMTNVRSVISGSAEDLAVLTDKARKMGATTGFSARETAEGMYVLGQAGLNARQIMETITPAMTLAYLGEMKLGTATDYLVATLSQFGLSTANAQDAVNVFAAAANASTTSVSRLALGFRNVGPLAASFGISMEDTAATLGVFAQAGFHGANAGVKMRNILTSLTVPSKALTDALAALHLKASDVNPKMHSLTEVLAKVAPLANSAALSTKLFAKANLSGFLALIRQGPSAIDDMRDAMRRQMSAGDIYAARMKTTQGAILVLKGALESLKIELFGVFKPQVLAGAQFMISWVNKIIDGLIILKPVIQSALGTISRVFSMFGKAASDAFHHFFTGYGQLVDAAQRGRQKVMEAVAPFVLYMTIVGIAVEDFFSGFIRGLRDAWSVASAVLSPMADAIGSLLSPLLRVLGLLDSQGNGWRSLGRIMGFVIGLVVTYSVVRWGLSVPARAIASWIEWGSVASAQMVRMSTGIVGFIGKMNLGARAAALLPPLMRAGAAAVSLFNGALAALAANPIVLLIGLVVALVAGLALVAVYWREIDNKLSGLSPTIKVVGAVFASLLSPIAALAIGVFLIAKHWDSITRVIKALTAPFVAWLQDVWRALEGFFINWYWNNLGTFQTTVGILKDVWRVAVNSLRVAFAAFVIGFRMTWNWIKYTLVPFIGSIWSDIKALAWGTIMWIVNGWQWVGRVVAGIAVWMMGRFVALREWLQESSLFSPLLRLADRAVSGLRDAFSRFINYLNSLELPGWLKSIIEFLKGKSGSWADVTERAARNIEKKARIDNPFALAGEAPKEASKEASSKAGVAGTDEWAKLMEGFSPPDRGKKTGSATGTYGKGAKSLSSQDVMGSLDLAAPGAAEAPPQPVTINMAPGAIQVTGVQDPDALARRLMPSISKIMKEKQDRGGRVFP